MERGAGGWGPTVNRFFVLGTMGLDLDKANWYIGNSRWVQMTPDGQKDVPFFSWETDRVKPAQVYICIYNPTAPDE